MTTLPTSRRQQHDSRAEMAGAYPRTLKEADMRDDQGCALGIPVDVWALICISLLVVAIAACEFSRGKNDVFKGELIEETVPPRNSAPKKPESLPELNTQLCFGVRVVVASL